MLEEKKIKHLYWRAGFGQSPEEWQRRRSWTTDRALDELFSSATDPKPLAGYPIPELDGGMQAMQKMAAKDKVALRKRERERVAEIGQHWIQRMADPQESPLLEKMCLFWHGHFACESKNSIVATKQLNLLRQHALGNFRDLLRAIARDPAMIRYLNNQQNRKNSPNENFARELMELFTLGRGQYTEQDVKEAARAFTGWSSNLRGEFLFRPRLHDYGEKEFLSKQGNFDGDDIIDVILEQEAVATFICGKLYRFFVNDTIDPARVRELAITFRTNDYELGPVLRQLFGSAWFYAPENVGNRIKSPVELLAGMMRQLHVTEIPLAGVIGLQRALGQLLFRPPNVAGWPGGRSWIDNSTLVLRLNLAGALFLAAEVDFQLPDDLEGEKRRRLKQLSAEFDLDPLRNLLATSATPSTALADYLLATPPNSPTRQTEQPELLALALLSTPEYQLC